MAQKIIQFIKSYIVPLTIGGTFYLAVIMLLLVAILVVCIIHLNRYRKIGERTVPNVPEKRHELLKKIKELEDSINVLREQTIALTTENKKQEELITNVGKGVRNALEAINSANQYILLNYKTFSDITYRINNIEINLLDCIPDFSPVENDEFNEITMTTDGFVFGNYVEQTVKPGKKLGNCIISKALVKRKESKETKDEQK